MLVSGNLKVRSYEPMSSILLHIPRTLKLLLIHTLLVQRLRILLAITEPIALISCNVVPIELHKTFHGPQFPQWLCFHVLVE